MMLNSRLVKYGLATFRHVNYYQVLGLNPDATAQQIKMKYYLLAKQYHPDVNDSQDAATLFSQINMAYEQLSDPAKRTLYDSQFDTTKTQDSHTYAKAEKYSQKGARKNKSGAFTQQDATFSKSYASLRRPARGTDITATLSVTLQEAVKGCIKTISVYRQLNCRGCLNKETIQKCFTCGAKGRIYPKGQTESQECIRCEGKGYTNDCTECKGTAKVTEKCEEQIKVTKGIVDEAMLRKEGHGNQGFKSSNGDLYVQVKLVPDSYFKVDGINVRSVNYINPSIAVLGGETQIQTLYGPVIVRIQGGTESGTEVRIPNKGFPSSYSKRVGDHITQLRISIPKDLDDTTKQLYEKLKFCTMSS